MTQDITPKDLGKRIAMLREIQGISREQFADKLGMTSAGYGKIERGETDVSFMRLQSIAKALKMSLSEILKMAEGGVYIFSGTFAESHYSIAQANNSVVGQVNNISKDKGEWLEHTLLNIQETLQKFDKRLSRLEEKI